MPDAAAKNDHPRAAAAAERVVANAMALAMEEAERPRNAVVGIFDRRCGNFIVSTGGSLG